MATRGKGRPTRLNAETVTAICDALSIGSSYELAALYAKISYPTLQNWLVVARKMRARLEAGESWRMTTHEKNLLDFLRQIDEANGEAGIKWQQVVDRAAKTDPAYAMNMLRLRFSGYSEAAQVQYTAPIDLTALTDDQLARIAAGENPADVLANPGPGGAGTAPTPAGDQPAAE